MSRYSEISAEDDPLVGKRVFLEVPNRKELEKIHGWLKDTSTFPWLNPEEPLPGPREAKELLERFQEIKKIIEKAKKPTKTQVVPFPGTIKPVELLFSIKRVADRELVGTIALRIFPYSRNSVVRTILAPDARGQHLGRDAKYCILRYAFDSLGLERVTSEMLEDNIANLRVNEALLFKTEGISRGKADVEGKRRDIRSMAITKRDWDVYARAALENFFRWQ